MMNDLTESSSVPRIRWYFDQRRLRYKIQERAKYSPQSMVLIITVLQKRAKIRSNLGVHPN